MEINLRAPDDLHWTIMWEGRHFRAYAQEMRGFFLQGATAPDAQTALDLAVARTRAGLPDRLPTIKLELKL